MGTRWYKYLYAFVMVSCPVHVPCEVGYLKSGSGRALHVLSHRVSDVLSSFFPSIDIALEKVSASEKSNFENQLQTTRDIINYY